MLSKQQNKLGLWMLISLVAGNMIGSGVFLLPSALAHFGSIGLVGWACTAVGAIFLALLFSRLSFLMPKTGGPYAYCHEAYGDFVGFQIAFNYWIAIWVGNAAIVVALVGYLNIYLPALHTSRWLSLWVSIGFVWLVTFINILGVREAGKVQLITAVLKLIPLLLIAVFGILYLHPHYLKVFNISGQSNFRALSDTATLTMWSFIGFESATVPAGNVINPRRNIPLATMIGTVLTAVVYIASTLGVMGSVTMSQLAHSTSPYADAASVIFGPWGRDLIGLAAVIACFGTLNGWVLVQAQVPLAAARDHLFPKPFAKCSKNGTPVFGLVASSLLITLLLVMRYGASLVNEFTFMISLAVLASLIPYLYTTGVELLLYVQGKAEFSRSRLIKSTILSLAAFAYAFWAIAGAGLEIAYYGLLLLLLSVPVYVWLRWKQRAAELQTLC